MAEHVVHHRLHVVRRDEVLPVQPGMGARHLVQPDGAARAHADLDPAVQLVVDGLGLARGMHQRDHVARDCFAHVDAMDLGTRGENRFGRQLLRGARLRARNSAGLLGARQRDDLRLGVRFRIGYVDVHQEAVHLRFRQRVGTLLLDRVLRGHDQEQRVELVRDATDGDLALFHRFEQRRLHLGRRTVDLVGEHQVGEDRPGLEAELTLAALGVVHLGARDIGRQQVRRELDARQLRLQVPRQHLDRARLGQARQSFHQQVAVSEQAQQHALDHVLLANDGFAHPLLQCQYVVTGAHGALLDGAGPGVRRPPPNQA
ncbi:hypothetical protein D9M72_477920 [compost metagenome]